MNDESDLLIEAGFSTSKMEAETRKVLARYEAAGKQSAQKFDNAMAKVSNNETLKATGREIDRLAKKYDPVYAKSKKYERGVKELNRAHEIGAINQAEYARGLTDLTMRLDRAEAGAQRFGNGMNSTSQGALRAGGGLQNLGYQVGDFAVQVGAGTSAAQALGQQLPQLLGGFGAIGALAGAGAAIFIPLSAALYKVVTSGQDVEEQMDLLTEATDSYVASAEMAKTPIDELREKYGDLAEEIAAVNGEQAIFAGARVRAASRDTIGALTTSFGGLDRDKNVALDNNRGFFSSLVDKSPVALIPEIDNTALTIAKELEIAEADAVKLVLALEQLNTASGVSDQVQAARDLQAVLIDVAGGADEAFAKFGDDGGILSNLKVIIANLAKQREASLSDEERRVEELFNTYATRTRELAALTSDRALAVGELQSAADAGDAARVDGARQVIAALDEEIDKLTDVEGRLGDVATEAEVLAAAAKRVSFDEDDAMMIAARDLADQVKRALENVDGLNDADLTILEAAAKRVKEMLEGVAGAATGAGGALSLAQQAAYEQYGNTRQIGASMDRGAGVAAARDGGILDLIGYAEGTDKGRGYNETLDYGRWTGGDRNLVNMTLKEVLALGDSMRTQENRDIYEGGGSSALGRYQIVGTTMRGLIDSLGLTGNELYDPQMQDRMAMELVRQRQGQGPQGYRNEWQGFNNISDEAINTALGNQSVPRVDAGVASDQAAATAEAARLEATMEREAAKTATERQRALEAETKEREGLLAVRTDYAELMRQQVADEEFEISLVGKSAEQQAILRAEYMLTQEAKRRGIDLNEQVAGSEETYAEAIKRTAAAMGQQVATEQDLNLAREQAAERTEFLNQVQGQLKDGLLDAILEGENFADVLSNVAKMLARAALEAALFNSGPFAGGGGGGLLGGLFGGLFGGGAETAIPSFATGTDYHVGGLARINDKFGGEILDLPNGTRVIPHDLSGRMVSGGMGRGGASTYAPQMSIVVQGDVGEANRNMMRAEIEQQNREFFAKWQKANSANNSRFN